VYSAYRNVTDFGLEIAHEAVSRRPPISLYRIVARTHSYTRTMRTFGICPSFTFLCRRAKPSLKLRFATFASLYGGRGRVGATVIVMPELHLSQTLGSSLISTHTVVSLTRRVWAQTEYWKVMLLDMDTLLVSRVDELLERPVPLIYTVRVHSRASPCAVCGLPV
jgi:hypothetical protein